MEKKIEDSKPILNRSRRQLLIGAALTPVVMTLHSAKVLAVDGALQGGASGPAPYSGAIRGSAAMNSYGGSIETENALYTAICTNTDSPSGIPLADYYGSVGHKGTEPTVLSHFLHWTESSSYRWQYSTEKGSINWTRRYEELLVAPVDEFITYLSGEIDTLVNATWASYPVQQAYQKIRDHSVPLPTDWNHEEFTVDDRNGVRAYYFDWPEKLKNLASELFYDLDYTEPPGDG